MYPKILQNVINFLLIRFQEATSVMTILLLFRNKSSRLESVCLFVCLLCESLLICPLIRPPPTLFAFPVFLIFSCFPYRKSSFKVVIDFEVELNMVLFCYWLIWLDWLDLKQGDQIFSEIWHGTGVWDVRSKHDMADISTEIANSQTSHITSIWIIYKWCCCGETTMTWMWLWIYSKFCPRYPIIHITTVDLFGDYTWCLKKKTPKQMHISCTIQ